MVRGVGRQATAILARGCGEFAPAGAACGNDAPMGPLGGSQLGARFVPRRDAGRVVPAGRAVATSPTKAGSSIQVKLGGITNPGGDKENQDDYFIFQSSDRSVIATGVLDGHGRELGQVASRVATQAMKDMFRASDLVDKIRVDAQASFEQLFNHAHEAIREVRPPAAVWRGARRAARRGGRPTRAPCASPGLSLPLRAGGHGGQVD